MKNLYNLTIKSLKFTLRNTFYFFKEIIEFNFYLKIKNF